jgi:hypothetical protein
MPNGNGNSQKNGKKKAPAKKGAASRSNGNGQNMLQRAEGAVGGAWKAAGDAYNQSQTARRNIWKGVKRSNGG